MTTKLPEMKHPIQVMPWNNEDVREVRGVYTRESVHALLEEIEKRMIHIETWAEKIFDGEECTEHLTWIGLINHEAEKTKEELRERREGK